MFDEFKPLRDLFELPTASALRLVTGQRSLPVNLKLLSDETVRCGLLWIAAFESEGTQESCPLNLVNILRKESNERSISGASNADATPILEALSRIYDIVYNAISNPPSIAQLDRLSRAEKTLQQLLNKARGRVDQRSFASLRRDR